VEISQRDIIMKLKAKIKELNKEIKEREGETGA
jgi:hypothetical protein